MYILPLTSQIPTFHSNRPRGGSKLEGSCWGSLNYPTEAEYIHACTDFCTKYLTRDGTIIPEDLPIMWTYNLKAADGKIVQWVLHNAAVDHVPDMRQALQTNTSECLDRFGSLLDSNVLGALGHTYCVMDGTGGGAFADQKDPAGQHGGARVVVWGGKVETGV